MQEKITKVFNGVTLLIPFLKHNDPVRASMSFNHLRQAMPLLQAEIPIVRTGFESFILKHSQSYFRENVKQFEKISANLYKINNQLAFMSPFVVYDQEDNIVYDKLFTKKVKTTIDNKNHYEYTFGVNLLVAYMNYFGYTYQDGCVISESAASRLKTFHTYIHTISLPSNFILNIIESISSNNSSGNKKSYFPIIGEKYSVLIDYISNGIRYQEKIRPSIVMDIIVDILPGYTITDPFLINIINKQKQKDQLLNKYIGMTNKKPNVKYPIVIHFILTEILDCKIGDKIANRHGNKAVINLVVPDKDMPYDTVLKRHVDLIYSPLSIPSRMNLGQLMEQALTKLLYLTKGKHKEIIIKLEKYRPIIKELLQGLPDDKLNNVESVVVYPFNDLNIYDLVDLLDEYNISETSPVKLDNKILNINTGFQYIMRLEHTAISKQTGMALSHTYTQSQGQRLGEMEVWNLIAHNGIDITKELFKRSNNLKDKIQLYSKQLGIDNYYDDIPDIDYEYAYLQTII